MENKKKYFVFSDVHSFYTYLKNALDKAGFDINNPNHIIISCGDLFDRGDEAKECLDFICKMIKKDRAICINGNHEDLLTSILTSGRGIADYDFSNGTIGTIEQISGIKFHNNGRYETLKRWKDVACTTCDNNDDLRLYLRSCVPYAEIGDNIFVHGWLPVEEICYNVKENGVIHMTSKFKIKDNWRNAGRQAWKDASWENGMELWHRGCKIEGKTIYCGHWHSSYGNCLFHHDGQEWSTSNKKMNNHTFKDNGIMALDAMTVKSHFVNVETFEV